MISEYRAIMQEFIVWVLINIIFLENMSGMMRVLNFRKCNFFFFYDMETGLTVCVQVKVKYLRLS